MARWTALIRDHQPGYISWEQFERNQRLLEENTHMKGTMTRKAGRGGQCLLAGLLRCARCGRMLHVMYGRRGYARYECRQANRAEAAPRCIGFSARRPDETVSAKILTVVQGSALAAAIEAGDLAEQDHHAQHRALALELEQATYQVALAARRYEAVDPDNRLVAAELEAQRMSSGWTISRAAGGEASIIMVRYASRPTPSSPPSARGFPPPEPLAFLRPARLPKGFHPRGASGAA
jgi:hypothetical protein